MTLMIVLALLGVIVLLFKSRIDDEKISRLANITTIILFAASLMQLVPLDLTPTNNQEPENDLITSNPKGFLPELSQFPDYLDLVADFSVSNLDIASEREDSEEYLKTLEASGRIISHIYQFEPRDRCDSQEEIAVVLLQLIIFDDVDKASQYLKTRSTPNEFQLESGEQIGDESRIFFNNSDTQSPALSWACDDLISITFMYRYENLIISTGVDGHEGRISKDGLISEAMKYARIIELNIKANE